jgi:DNA-binding transcriptional regulator YhcF (GntR family)
MKSPKKSEVPVFAQALHYIRQRMASKTVMPGKTKKRDNTFSKSRDTREDRGTRQGKTMNNSRTQSRGH